MSISSINEYDKINWPAGATAKLAEGKSTSGFYTYPTSLSAGIYAVRATSLSKENASVSVELTANAQNKNLTSGAVGYFNLTTTETSFALSPLGGLPQSYTARTGGIPATTYFIAYGNGRIVLSDGGGNKNAYVATDPEGPWTTISFSTLLPDVPTGDNYIATYENNRYIVGIGGYLVSSTDTTTWSAHNIYGLTTINANRVRYENGLYLLAGDRSRLATSTDLNTWTNHSGTGVVANSSFTNYYANGTYLLAGTAGKIETSSDGIGWIYQKTASTTNMRASVYGDKWVVCGDAGQLQTSTDAITWTSRTSSFGTTAITAVDYNGSSLYVAVGAAGQGRSSTDGITWTSFDTTFGASAINSAKYLNGTWITVGSAGQLRTSTDAVTWTTRTSGFGTSAINDVTYGNGYYVAAGAGGRVSYSTDSVTWTGVASGVTTALEDVTYFNGYYLLCGASGVLRSTTDFVTWSAVTSGTTGAIYRFSKVSNSKIFATATAGTVISSTDGVTWVNEGTRITGAVSQFFDFRYINGKYYAINATTNVYASSTDLITWTTSGVGASAFPAYSLMYGNSRFVAVGNSGYISTSTDAITWSDTLISTVNFYDVNYVGDKYIAVGDAGFAYSTDNITWTAGSEVAGINGAFNAIKIPGGNYYVGGDSVSLSMSTNGIAWTPGYARLSIADLDYFAFANKFIAVADRSSVISTDGINWTTYDVGQSITFDGLGSYVGVNTLLGVGAGNISTSTDGITWSSPVSLTSASGRPAVGKIGSVNLFYVGKFGTNDSGVYFSTTGSAFSNVAVTTSGTKFVRSVGFYNGYALAGLTDGTFTYSTTTTGSSWTEVTPAALSGLTIQAIGGGNGYFYAAGNGGNIGISTNLTTWNLYNVGNTSTIKKVIAIDGVWIVTCENGYYSQSTDGINWTSGQIGTTVINALTGYDSTYLLASEKVIYKSNVNYPMFYSIYSVNPGEIA